MCLPEVVVIHYIATQTGRTFNVLIEMIIPDDVERKKWSPKFTGSVFSVQDSGARHLVFLLKDMNDLFLVFLSIMTYLFSDIFFKSAIG